MLRSTGGFGQYRTARFDVAYLLGGGTATERAGQAWPSWQAVQPRRDSNAMTHVPLLIGIGGAGAAMATHVNAAVGGRLVLINAAEALPRGTDITTIALSSRPHRLRRAEDISSLLQLGRANMEAVLAGASQVFLFCGLGGAVGSGAAPVVAKVALECGHEVAAFVTLPLAVEGSVCDVAAHALAALRRACSLLSVHDHERESGRSVNVGLSMNAFLALAAAAALAFTLEQTRVPA